MTYDSFAAEEFASKDVFLFHFRYILGPSSLITETSPKIAIAYVQIDSKFTKCYLVVYRALNATLCLLLNGNNRLILGY